MTVRDSTVADVMTREVVTAGEDMPFKTLVSRMETHEISGLPIVDADRRVVGMATEADLLKFARRRTRRSRFLEWFIEPARLREIEQRTEDLRATDLMTRDVVTVRPGTPIREAVQVMLRARVKRLPVVDRDGRLVGIVSRGDLLQPYLRTDEAIRTEIVEEVLRRTMWMDPMSIDVDVSHGVVTLRGTVERRSTKKILAEIVRRVGGVVGVDDEVTFEKDDRHIRTPAPWGAPLPGALRTR